MAYALEQIDSRSFSKGENPRVTFVFKVFDTDDQEVAEATASAVCPAVYGSPSFGVLVKQEVQGEPRGPGLWNVDVIYGASKMGEVGEVEWEFDVGTGGSAHLSTSLETVGSHAASGTPPDFNRAINVKREGAFLKAQGIDVDDTKFTWSETHYLSHALVNSFTYINTLMGLRGKTNDGAWRGFAEGEVRFLNARGRGRGEWTVPVTFSFAAGPNLTDLEVGSITGIDKKAFEYMWAFHDYEEDAAASALVLAPTAVYVERIFESGDFAALGITNPWT